MMNTRPFLFAAIFVLASLIASPAYAECESVDLMYYQLHTDTHPIVEGKAVNSSRQTVKFVEVTFALVGQDGNQLRMVSDMTMELKADSAWLFEASARIDGVASAEFQELTCQEN